MKKNSVLISVTIIIVALILVTFSFNIYSSINISANPVLELQVNEDFEIPEAQASIGNTDVSSKITSTNNININEIGEYTITYSIRSLIFSKLVVTQVKVIDNLAPTIDFHGNRIIVTDGSTASLTYTINDNYYSPDEILIETSDNIDYDKDGTYFVNYKLIDPSENSSSFQREIIVDHTFKGLTFKSSAILSENKSPLTDYELISDEHINDEQTFDYIQTIYDLNEVEDWLYDNSPNYLVVNISYYDIQQTPVLEVIDEYQKAIREIMTLSPKTRIYICSVLPSFKDETLSNHDILIYNYYLLNLCEDLNIRFVNLNEAFIDAENKTIQSYFEKPNVLSLDGLKVYNAYLEKHLQTYTLLRQY